MARKELRHTDIKIKDGLSGAGELDTTAPMAADTDMDVTNVVLNTDVTDQIPIGAKFTVATETDTVEHTVTARTPTSGTTTNVEFTPALGAGTYMSGDAVTFLPQELTIKVGDGTVSWTENKNFSYDLDRGDLDTVRELDQQPLSVNFAFIFEYVTAGTGESITPVDALKRQGDASEWVNAAADPCEPYAVDIEIVDTPACGSADLETILFPDFRYESLEYNINDAQITVSGKCNAIAPTSTRTAQS